MVFDNFQDHYISIPNFFNLTEFMICLIGAAASIQRISFKMIGRSKTTVLIYCNVLKCSNFFNKIK